MTAIVARRGTGIAFLLITIAAIALQRGATLPVATAPLADGTRVEVSPIGLVRMAAAGSPGAECRWWPRLGDPSLCAVAEGGAAAMARVRRAYPATMIALWVSVLSLFLNVLRIPRLLPWIGPLATAFASGSAAFAVWALAGSGDAFSVLAGTSVRLAGSGFYAIAGAAVLTAVATGLLARSSRTTA